jgi:pyruvate,water dikinase
LRNVSCCPAFQSELENAIRDAYDLLSADDAEASFAVRSSATADR